MISSRAKYATRAILDLALHPGPPVQISEIASRQNIPLKFLEQILLALKRQGFVDSRKGPGGGYSLSRPATEISLGAVVRAVDGPVAPISCVSVTRFMECGCPDPAICSLRVVWKDARDALAAVLDNASFGDIAERYRANEAAPPDAIDYSI